MIDFKSPELVSAKNDWPSPCITDELAMLNTAAGTVDGMKVDALCHGFHPELLQEA